MPLLILAGLTISIMFFYIIYLWSTDGRIRSLQYEKRDLERKVAFLVEEFGEEGKEASERWEKMNKQ
jgi:hypothetical protein